MPEALPQSVPPIFSATLPPPSSLPCYWPPMVPVPLRRVARKLSAATPMSVPADDASGPDGSFTRALLASLARTSHSPSTLTPFLQVAVVVREVERAFNSPPRVQPHHEVQCGVGRLPNSLSLHAQLGRCPMRPRLWFGLALRRAPSRQSACSNADHREPPLNPPGINGGMQRGYTVPCSAVPRVAPAVVETGPRREGGPPTQPAPRQLTRTLSLAQLRGANQIGVPRMQFGGHPRRGDRCYSKLTASIVLTTDHPRVPRERHLCPRLWVGLALRRAPSRQ